MLLPTAFDWHVIKDEILGMTITTWNVVKLKLLVLKLSFKKNSKKFYYLSTLWKCQLVDIETKATMTSSADANFIHRYGNKDILMRRFLSEKSLNKCRSILLQIKNFFIGQDFPFLYLCSWMGIWKVQLSDLLFVRSIPIRRPSSKASMFSLKLGLSPPRRH